MLVVTISTPDFLLSCRTLLRHPIPVLRYLSVYSRYHQIQAPRGQYIGTEKVKHEPFVMRRRRMVLSTPFPRPNMKRQLTLRRWKRGGTRFAFTIGVMWSRM